MNIFRQLRWKLTLSYTLVTMGAFLVILLIMAGMVFYQLFIPENYLSPERLLDNFLASEAPSMLDHVLSQSPVDKRLVDYILDNPEMIISSSELFRIGALQFSVSTQAVVRIMLLGADGTILGTYRGGSLETQVGHPIDASRIPGLEAPLKAALAGETDSSRLYTMIEPNRQFILAYPVFKQASTEEGQVLGAVVIFFDAFPTRADVPSYIGQIAIRSLLIFVLGVGIIGALFGYIFSHGLASQFNRISAITDLWSEGDFSRYIEDTVGDEISQLAGRLNNMAKQLQSLLRRRQEMAVSEERNKLARDLHDSAKQQALAASFELGTALTLYERDPQQAKKHLVEADGLVDAVRKELTNLVDELRPRSMAGQDFSETLKEHAAEWSHRSGIALAIRIDRKRRTLRGGAGNPVSNRAGSPG